MYSQTTPYYHCFHVYILAPDAFNLVTVKLWENFKKGPHFKM